MSLQKLKKIDFFGIDVLILIEHKSKKMKFVDIAKIKARKEW